MADEAHVAANEPKRRVMGLAAGQEQYRLLVVDDNDVSRQLLATLLQKIGFEVREATNGQEAVKVREEWQPHLIWMDMRMPVMDGYEATKKIQSAIRNQKSAIRTKIIALTASAFEEDRTKVLDCGCDDFQRKPFKEVEIFELMHTYLGVQYVYAEAEQPKETQKAKLDILQLQKAVNKIAGDVRADFQKAVTTADIDSAMEVVSRIQPHDELLAENLKDLLNSYRFDTLQEILRGNGNE
jgi:CheY-like chemotaxis protein